MLVVVAMLATIALMIGLDAVHPPAVSTSLSFAFRAGPDSNLLLFALAVGIVAVLIVLERSSLWLVAKGAADSASSRRSR